MSFQIPGGDSWSNINQVSSSQRSNSDGGGGNGASYSPMPDIKNGVDELDISTNKDDEDLIVDTSLIKALKEWFLSLWKSFIALFKDNSSDK